MRKLFLFISLLFCLTICSAQKPWICVTYPILHNDYYENEQYYHSYIVSEVVICPVDNKKGLTVDDVFNIMISNISFVAPTINQEKVISCNKVILVPPVFPDIFLESLDSAKEVKDWILGKVSAPIVTYINNEEHSVTNYTLEGHPLHDGKVTRTVVVVDGNIKIKTVGIGNNKTWRGWKVNSFIPLIKYLWKSVDNKLKAEVERKLNVAGEDKTSQDSLAADGSKNNEIIHDAVWVETENKKRIAQMEKQRADANKPTSGKKVFSGCKTPDELGKKLVLAIKTNNKNMWYDCILSEPRGRTDTCFEWVRQCLSAHGVSDWKLLTFSRITYSNTSTMGEKTYGFFSIEFDYGNKFWGTFGSSNYALVYKDQFMLHHGYADCAVRRR